MCAGTQNQSVWHLIERFLTWDWWKAKSQWENCTGSAIYTCVDRQFDDHDDDHDDHHLLWIGNLMIMIMPLRLLKCLPKLQINSSLCTVPFMPFLKCPSAMPFLKCPSAMPFLNCPSRIRFLKMPFLNYFPPKDALPQNSFPKKCPSLTCPPTIPHQRQCKHCNN